MKKSGMPQGNAAFFALFFSRCVRRFKSPRPALSNHSAQAFNQPVQFIHRRKLDRQLAHLFTFAVALDLLFNAHFHLRHQQVGQLLFHAAGVAAF